MAVGWILECAVGFGGDTREGVGRAAPLVGRAAGQSHLGEHAGTAGDTFVINHRVRPSSGSVEIKLLLNQAAA